MKDQILKIAGVKSEKEFYKKYPSEEAFMKKHGKAFKKAAMGASMVKQQLTQLTDFSNPPQARVGDFIGVNDGGNSLPNTPISFSKLYDANDLDVTGTTDAKRMQVANLQAQQAQAAAANKKGSSGGFDIGQAIQLGTQAASMMGKNGKRVPKAQQGVNMDQASQIGGFSSTPSTATYDPTTGQVNNPSGSVSQGDVQALGFGTNAPSASTNYGKYLGPAGQLIDAFGKLKSEKKALDQSNQFAQVSGVVAQAAGTRPERVRRKYVRPEDQVVNPGELNNPYGVGTNVLNARQGAEIQNTYAPNDIYQDLGYEPLNDSIKQYRRGGHIPMAQSGFSDFAGSPMGGQAADMVGNLGSLASGGKYGESNAGGDIGGTIGGTVGQIFGPVGGMVGKAIGNFAGRLLDKNPQKTRAFQQQGQNNLQRSAFQQGAQQLQAENAGFMEDGGWMNPNYNPQVITKFGDIDVSDIHNIATKGMNTLRSGGHLTNYTPPTEEAMQTYAMGGELQTHWGGEMEPISYNPHLPGDGITYMPRGQSHEEYDGNGRSGIGITYGNNPVEVERGEPITKLKDGGTGGDNLMVYGNMQIPSYGVSELEDEDAKGRKFKHYANDLSKVEVKQNKIVDKATKLLDDSNDNNAFGQLAFASGQANLIGANMKLKEVADKKKILAGIQNAILDTAKEHGVVADELAKGKIVKDKSSPEQAMFGAKMETAQDGWKFNNTNRDNLNLRLNGLIDLIGSKGYDVQSGPESGVSKRNTKSGRPSRHSTGEALDAMFPKLGDKAYETILKDPDVSKYLLENGLTAINEYDPATAKKTGATAGHLHFGFDAGTPTADKFRNDASKLYPEVSQKTIQSAKIPVTGKVIPNAPSGDIYSNLPEYESSLTPVTVAGVRKKTPPTDLTSTQPPPIKSDWKDVAFDAASSILPKFRSTNQLTLDPSQLSGEMYALSNNQLEPVQAQQYQPRLQQPYDVSYQDMLNANQSDFNAVQRQAGNNPAALAALAGQKYGANEKVLGEQFRANQAEKAGVYNGNLQTLNDATLKNLSILDQQYQRQSQAKSNTKAVGQSALSSIASKIAQNKLENRKAAINENLYNYRFDPETGRAINENGLASFNMSGNPFSKMNGNSKGLAPGYGFSYDENQQIIGTRKLPKEETGKNGAKIKARNGSIVKAIKNL